MQLIELKLDGKLLHYKNGSRQYFDVVANNDDYCVRVTFAEPRPNAVGVIFEMFGIPYTVLLDENNVAAVPDGVLIGGKKLRVGLSWGEDLDEENLTGTMTSTDLEILVRYSIRSRLREQPLPAPSNADFLTTITALVNSIKNVDTVAVDEGTGHLIITLTNGSTQDAGPVVGPQGISAYEVAVAAGFSGNVAAWLASLVGPQGKSAYQVAVDGGFSGTEQEWLTSLEGEDGDDYVLTSSDKEEIFALVLAELPTAEGAYYPPIDSAEGVSF